MEQSGVKTGHARRLKTNNQETCCRNSTTETLKLGEFASIPAGYRLPAIRPLSIKIRRDATFQQSRFRAESASTIVIQLPPDLRDFQHLVAAARVECGRQLIKQHHFRFDHRRARAIATLLFGRLTAPEG